MMIQKEVMEQIDSVWNWGRVKFGNLYETKQLTTAALVLLCGPVLCLRNVHLISASTIESQEPSAIKLFFSHHNGLDMGFWTSLGLLPNIILTNYTCTTKVQGTDTRGKKDHNSHVLLKHVLDAREAGPKCFFENHASLSSW